MQAEWKYIHLTLQGHDFKDNLSYVKIFQSKEKKNVNLEVIWANHIKKYFHRLFS